MHTFVILRTFDSYIKANLILSFLLDQFINCHLQDENTMLADPLLGNAIGGIKLMVHHTQQERALDLIEQFEKKE
jgi:hypothetical protein